MTTPEFNKVVEDQLTRIRNVLVKKAAEYNLDDAKKEEIGLIFGKILENCGVFKNTEKGNAGIVKFVKSIR